APRPASPPAATGGDAYSTTNVQEAGIDEPDVIKTDGKRIYALSNGKLYVVDAASPRIVGSFDVGNANEMFVDRDRAMVFGGGGGYAQPMASSGGTASSGMAVDSAHPYRAQVQITVLDVSAPS